jgi:hypothetical protein
VGGDAFALEVETVPDAFGEALPRRFRLGSRTVEAAEILDRWPGGGHLYVKLRGSDGATYILRQDLDRGGWRLVLFRDLRAPDQPDRPRNGPLAGAF